jgi:hypothetical protein
LLVATIGLAYVLANRVAQAVTCPAIANVQGVAEIVESVRVMLRAHGIAVEPSPELARCAERSVHAWLRREPPSRSYALHIEDPFGRTSDRQVSDAETAASLIESWALPLAAALAAPSPIPAVVRQETDNLPRAKETPAIHWRLTGALEVAGGSDDSLWYGGTLTGCANVTTLCVGGRLRIARDDSVWGPDRDVTRSGTELLALVTLPLVRHGVRLAPMMGLGVGWVHTGPPQGEPDNMSRVSDDLALRWEAAVNAEIPLSAHLSLVGEIGVSLGRSIAASSRAGGGEVIFDAPTGYLRAAVACQYAP